MSKYLLDTNTCIEYFKRRNGVPERMAAVPLEDLCVSEVTIAELLYGAVTDNLRHFSRMPGVLVENWVSRPPAGTE